MTLSEFKAWFSGFTEMMDGPPNADQWSRIQARIKEIDDRPASKPVAYRETGRPFWPDGARFLTAGELPRNGGMDHANPLHDLGRAEFRSMTT